MSAPPPELTYAVVTAARNEADNLPRLAASLAAQSVTPSTWVIVENGSSDDTLRISDELSEKHDWVRVLTLGEPGPPRAGAPIVRAIEAAIETLGDDSDVVVNVDADVSMDEQFFAQILEAFARDPELGICSGTHTSWRRGRLEAAVLTGGSIWGATRAYRRACLDDVLPFERRHGWDGMDQLRARSKGWTTRVLDLPFLHHRREGEREGSRWAHWKVVGRAPTTWATGSGTCSCELHTRRGTTRRRSRWSGASSRPSPGADHAGMTRRHGRAATRPAPHDARRAAP